MSVPLLKSATARKKDSPVRAWRIGTILASVEMNVYYVNVTCGVCDFINHAAGISVWAVDPSGNGHFWDKAGTVAIF